MNNTTNKLPKELRANYRVNRKGSSVIEQLKVAAALKLWGDRGYRNVRFEMTLSFGGRRLFAKVLAQNANGIVGVECASSLKLRWLRGRMAQLRRCLPADSWLILVFPSTVDDRVKKTARLADEVWITGKDGTVEQIMFITVFHRD